MKVLAICGSPRKGNTEFALNKFLQGCKQQGAKTELILLRKKKMGLCAGNLKCEKTQKCHIKDDMKVILKKLLDADLIVLGTPTYFDMPTALMKIFIDRTASFYPGLKLKGKSAALIVIGGAPLGEGSIENAMRCMKHFCKIHHVVVVEDIVIGDTEKLGSLAKNKKAVARLVVAGRKTVLKLRKK